MSGYDDFLVADARLTMLKELSRQTDGRLNESVLTVVLDAFGFRRSREWVRTQIRKLEELGAVKVDEQGTVLVATITRAGLDHIDRRSTIEGIARPSLGA